MSWSTKLFRVKGIDIKVHLTFVLILIWAAYRWGIEMRAGLAGALYGVVVILLLFACVTIHELAHSLMAMHYGVKVRDITLLPIGGLSQMEEMPKKPAQELRMSLAGPLSNFVIALLLFLLDILFGIGAGLTPGRLNQVLGSVSWQGLPSYLALSNLLLGVFNLLPAYPMDGGRVLRAFLAMRMDYAKATSWAVNIGQGLAWFLGLFGVLSGNWMLVIIAMFIYLGAGQEGRRVEVKNVLGELRASQAMAQTLQTLTPEASLAQAVNLILHGFQTDFPVLEDGKLIGFLTETDLVTALKKHGPETTVREAMRIDFPIADPGEALFDVQQKMGKSRLRSIPVTKGGQLAGLITAQDINEAFLFISLSPGLIRKT